MASDGDMPAGQMGKAVGRNPIGRRAQESDEGVVPQNPPKAAAEAREGRPEATGNPAQPTVAGTQRPAHTSSGLDRIREASKRDGDIRFTSLMHHITPNLLMASYEALRRNAAPGVDGETWQTYGDDGLDARIADLHARDTRISGDNFGQLWTPAFLDTVNKLQRLRTHLHRTSPPP